MKTLLVILLALLPPAATRSKADESPFVRNLGVLSAADRVRKEEISLALRALITGVSELVDETKLGIRN